jgi:hypothetical protein
MEKYIFKEIISPNYPEGIFDNSPGQSQWGKETIHPSKSRRDD